VAKYGYNKSRLFFKLSLKKGWIMKKQVLAVLLFLSVLAGCARCILVRSEYYDLTGKVVEPKDDKREIALLTTAPDKPFEEIGVVKVMARWGTSREAMDKEIKRRAREAGADAVMDLEYGEDTENTLLLCGKIGSTKRNKIVRGKAIVFKVITEKENKSLVKENK
jgi:hypothetical protein